MVWVLVEVVGIRGEKSSRSPDDDAVEVGCVTFAVLSTGLAANTPVPGNSASLLIRALLLNISESRSGSACGIAESASRNMDGGNGEGDLGKGNTRVSDRSGREMAGVGAPILESLEVNAGPGAA